MSFRRDQFRLPPVTLLIVIVEFFVILLAAFWATRNLQNMSPLLQWGGGDLPLLTQGAGFATRIFKETGAIPLWNPLIGNGEPMFESAQSFILNPLMFGPILLLGPIVGTKVGILLHIVLMGLGGWTLARVLGLRWAGRIMMGVFLVGSGSMAAAMGRGLYQLGLSQAYMPWIFAGLIGTLYSSRRWCVGVFVVATMLLVFAGTFWFVLPTAISCAILSMFAFLRKTRYVIVFEINRHTMRQLLIAAVFIAGLCAIRLLPFNRSLLHHPSSSDPFVSTFLVKASTYFSPITITPGGDDWWMNFHYVLPSLFAIVIVVSLVVLFIGGYRREPFGPNLWRVFFPAVLIIALFTLWGEGETDFNRWVYTQIPFLSDWRNTGRIAAAASNWVIILAAIGFDLIIDFLTQAFRRHELLFNGIQLPDKSRAFVLTSRPLIAVFLVACGFAALDVLGNWDRFNHLFDVIQENEFRGEVDGLTYLRSRFPDSMLIVQTHGWTNHFGFVDTLSRSVFGDADVFTLGVTSTIGGFTPMLYFGNFAVGANYDFVNWIKSYGFVPFDDSPRLNDVPLVWYDPEVPPYAFWMPRDRLVTHSDTPLATWETQPVTYTHHIDSIDLIVADYPADAVLVVDETDYPGWTVSIDGTPATVEFIGGRLGVLLPNPNRPGAPTYVTFSYQPNVLRVGAVILFITGTIFVGYLLRLDKHVRVPEPLRSWAGRLSERAIVILTTPGAFEEYNREEPPVPLLKQSTHFLTAGERQNDESVADGTPNPP